MDEQNKKEKITTMDELAVMINNGFQANQEYMDKKFDEVKNELRGEINEVKMDLKQEIKGVDKKLTEFIDRYDESKLEIRVEYIENTLNLPKK